MLQPSTVVTVDCQDEDEDDEEEERKDDESWQLPLVLASLRVFTDAATNRSSSDAEESNVTAADLGCAWSGWSEWSSCSISCGGRGSVSRSRSQTGSRVCQDTDHETRDCQTNLCPVDCEMSVWSAWSPCSRSCGTGVRSRQRSVTTPPQHWGAQCPTNLEEEEPCVVGECRVDGGWSEWSRWGYCSESCGSGLRSRSRTCTNPAPQFGGSDCVGANLESKECYLKVCPPVDGGWSAWSRWSVCSKSCGWGEQRRTRSCSRPRAEHGGMECSGDRFQNNKCMLKRCPWDKTLENRESDEQNKTQIKPETVTCGPPPHVLGFLSPSVQSEDNATAAGVRVIYTCSRGRVLDRFTNKRSFSIICQNNATYSEPDQWPQCVTPTHCVGPARLVSDTDTVYLPAPRRDARVNSRVKYRCKHSPGHTVSAGCFYDGVYRYDSSWPSCTSSSSDNADLCSAAETSDSQNSNIVIAMPSLSRDSHGWLSSPDYPRHHNKSAHCSYTLSAPPGFILVIGVEDIRHGATDQSSKCLELKENNSYSVSKLITTSDKGESFVTSSNVVTVKSFADINHAWRLSYLVVEP